MKTAPAFMFYASDAIADKHYRMMSLAERGLYISMLCECWVNRIVPANPEAMAKWLGYPVDEINSAFTERVRSLFTQANGELTSPELERYRKELESRREKQSTGGRKGAKTKWDKAFKPDGHPNGLPNRGVMGSRVERSREEKIKSESLGRPDITDPWISDYERISNGG